MNTKTIGYRTAQTAQRKFNDFFKGRTDCRFFEVTQDDFDEEDNFGPGGYIEGPARIIEAWDGALAKIKRMKMRSGHAELVKTMLDEAESQI